MANGVINPRIGIIGAGPGGLAAAVLLARRGFDVTVFERHDRVGGRNGALREHGYTFDIGPTFFTLPFVLEDIFAEAGRSLSAFLDIRAVDPLCRFSFADGAVFEPGADPAATRASLRRLHAPDAGGFDRFMARHRRLANALLPCLAKPFDQPWHLTRLDLLKALPLLDLPKNLWSRLGEFFQDDRARTAFAFTAPFLGASPFTGPAFFSLLPYAAQRWGVHHPIGGCNALSGALEKLARELGARFLLGAEVAEVDVENGDAKAVILSDGNRFSFDEIVMNADVAWGLRNLVPEAARRKHRNAALDKMRHSGSAFMMYLGVDKEFPGLAHHNVFFAADPARNFRDVEEGRVPEDPSFYVQNASVTDPTLAPAGHAALYVLAPMPNLKSRVDWSKEKESVRKKIYRSLAARAGLENLESHVRFERVATPEDWRDNMRLSHGATFHLAHNPGQMLLGRPHNKLEGFENLWLVGGGTHPGGGLPLIYMSARVTADGIAAKHRRRVPLRIPLPRAVRMRVPTPAPVPTL